MILSSLNYKPHSNMQLEVLKLEVVYLDFQNIGHLCKLEICILELSWCTFHIVLDPG